ncbi:MAG: UDP-3-O-(3-hydroxymyristoyl)glucosamine N-acyltransferase [Halobacteriovoraceae bacterium]|nr:UDP-3-O-(3-hydroxymyristoyl)glucosamine N-acyltransferase [Halobacteriovoraceae bacterium]
MNVGEIASLLEANVEIEVKGNTELEIVGVKDIFNFAPKNVIFIRDIKFLIKFKENTPISKDFLLLIVKKVVDGCEKSDLDWLLSLSEATIITSDFSRTICILTKAFYDERNASLNEMVDSRQMGTSRIHPTAWIAQNVFIGQNVVIEENVKLHTGVVVLSNSTIGKGCEIFPNVVIQRNVEIGENCTIQSNSTIGSDGFGYEFIDGKHQRIYHLGGVKIGSNVDIGPNCTIDQGTYSPTTIGDGCKLDDHVHIAHNCSLGNHCLFCGHVAIAGSVKVGNYVVLGGKVGVSDNVYIGDASQIAAGALVTKSFPAQSLLGGFPARKHRDWLKSLAKINRL